MADPAQIDPTLESSEGSDDNILGAAAQSNPILESPSDFETYDINLQVDPFHDDSPQDFDASLPHTDPTLDPNEVPLNCQEIFADDIIKEVYPWITGVYLPNPRVRSPVNPKFKLSVEDKGYIQDLLEADGPTLKKYIGEKRGEKPWLYTNETYKELKREIVNKYKDEVYSEKGFVRLCAAVAFVAIGNQSLQENKDGAEDASCELYNFIRQVLKPGGNIHHSEWAEDVGEQGSSGAGVGEP